MKKPRLGTRTALVVAGVFLAAQPPAVADILAFNVSFGMYIQRGWTDIWCDQTVYPQCPAEAVLQDDDYLLTFSGASHTLPDSGTWTLEGEGLGYVEGGTFEILNRTVLQDEHIEEIPGTYTWYYRDTLAGRLIPEPGAAPNGFDWDGIDLVLSCQCTLVSGPYGYYMRRDGMLSGFIPGQVVPEPASLSLLALGLGTLLTYKLSGRKA